MSHGECARRSSETREVRSNPSKGVSIPHERSLRGTVKRCPEGREPGSHEHLNPGCGGYCFSVVGRLPAGNSFTLKNARYSIARLSDPHLRADGMSRCTARFQMPTRMSLHSPQWRTWRFQRKELPAGSRPTYRENSNRTARIQMLIAIRAHDLRGIALPCPEGLLSCGIETPLLGLETNLPCFRWNARALPVRHLQNCNQSEQLIPYT